MPQMPSAAEALQRWQSGVSGAGARYTQGVQNSNDWAGAYTAQVQTMASNFQQAVAEGRPQQGAQNLGTAGWRSATTAKAGNWTTGVSTPRAAQNYQAGYQKLVGFIQAGQSAIQGMPRGDYAANKARLNAYIDAVHQAAQNG